MSDETPLMKAAAEIRADESALGVLVVVFREGTRYDMAWAGVDEKLGASMRAFGAEVERLIVPASPRELGEISDPKTEG